VGLDNIDLAAAKRREIAVIYAPGSTTSAVAEHTLMLMLAAARRLRQTAAAVHAGNWAVRDGYGGLLVQAEQELRLVVAEIIDEGIVQSAKAGTRIDGYVGDLERTQRLGYGVAAELGRVATGAGGARTLDSRCAGIRHDMPLRTQVSILPDR